MLFRSVAECCDYVGAGTVEFLLDEQFNFYFLEMNTRLQVEHPVTEWITGVDLVEQQIRVARGEKLSLTQENLKISGHALELRIYAEDSLHDFLPSIGTLTKYSPPTGENIRVDDGYEEGMTIPIFYDPMLAKLITYGKNRSEAIEQMIAAIADYQIEGVATTLSFGDFVCRHEAFVSGNFDTNFIKKYYAPESLKKDHELEANVAAKLALQLFLKQKEILKVPSHSPTEWNFRHQ